jgi:hypothetical protein
MGFSASRQEALLSRQKRGVHNKIPDSGFRRNDERGGIVIPGKAAGRDPESRKN